MLTDPLIHVYPYLFAGTTLSALVLPLLLAARDARNRRRQRLALARIPHQSELSPFGAHHPQFVSPLPKRRPERSMNASPVRRAA